MRRRAFLAGTLLLLPGTATACAGSDEPATGGSAASGPMTLRVGILPVANMAPLYLGMEKGFFDAEDLNLELVTLQGGAAMVPSVVSGDFQFAYGNVVSLMQARDKGLGLQIVQAGIQTADSPANSGNGLLVAKDSGIRSVADLAGTKVAVTTLDNIGGLTTRATLESHNVDHSGIEFVELGFPDMNAAVRGGRVDVAWQAEPFVTMGENKGLRNVADPFLETLPNLDAAAYFAAEDYIDQNPGVIERFQRAMSKSNDYAQRHREEAHQIVPEHTEISPDVAQAMQLAQYPSALNMESIRLQAKLANKYGMVESKVDVGALLAPGANAE